MKTTLKAKLATLATYAAGSVVAMAGVCVLGCGIYGVVAVAFAMTAVAETVLLPVLES